MSAAIVSSFNNEYRDLYKGLQSHRATADIRQQVSALERHFNSYAASSLFNIPISSQGSPIAALKKLTSLSAIKSPTKQHAPLTSSNSVANCNAASHLKSASSTKEHRKLDRSVSEPADRSQANPRPVPPNSSRYKTELCRPYEENGTCKYGDKCQFAHGAGELRSLTRHPKYKTELCRTFHTTGLCPYGPRCHFIHNSEDSKKCLLNTLQTSNGNVGTVNMSLPKPSASMTKDLEICSFSLGSAGELSPTSSHSSGSPTSSVGGFFLDDNHLSYNLPQAPQTAPPIVSNGFFFGPDYNAPPPTLTIPNLVSPTTDTFYPSQQTQQGFETGDKMINLLVSEIDNLKCHEENVKTELPSPKTEQQVTDVDINRNIIRLPIFSKLAHGNTL